jgi:hypothetical protein
MVAHVKPHAFGSRGIQNHEDTKFFGSNPRFFYGAIFSGPLALDIVMRDIPSNHIFELANDGNLVGVSTTALVIRANAHVPKP